MHTRKYKDMGKYKDLGKYKRLGKNKSKKYIQKGGASKIPKDIEELIRLIPTTPDFVKDNNVFNIYGHGCSLYDEYLDVPPGCVYVTYGTCGNKTYLNDERLTLFEKMFNAGDPILKDPVKNSKQLKELFGDTLHIHTHGPGKYGKYLNTVYNPIRGWSKPSQDPYIKQNFPKATEVKYMYSGLVQLGNKLKMNIKVANPNKIPLSKVKTKEFLNDYLIKNEHPDIVVPINKRFYAKYILNPEVFNPFYNYEVNEIFKSSIFPSKEDVDGYAIAYNSTHRKSLLEFIRTTFRIDQKHLFKHLPGVYYNMICRNPCSKQDDPETLRMTEEYKKKSNEADADFFKEHAELHAQTMIEKLEKEQKAKKAKASREATKMRKLLERELVKAPSPPKEAKAPSPPKETKAPSPPKETKAPSPPKETKVPSPPKAPSPPLKIKRTVRIRIKAPNKTKKNVSDPVIES